MDQKVLDLLNKEKSSVLSIALSDGTPHASCMAFCFKESPSEIFFMTDKDTKKVEPLLSGLSAKSSFVIGLTEDNMVTLQMDGVIKIEEDRGKVEEMKKVYFEKYPDHKHYEQPDSCWMIFVPTWWRYTDFKPIPNYILTS